MLWRPAHLPAVIATCVVGCGAIFADRQNLEIHRQEVRADTLAKVNLIRAKLEGHLNGNLQLVRGLVAIVASEPDIDQARFAEVVGSLLTHGSHLINVTGAPDFVVRFMYPLPGDSKVLGLDYLKERRLREAALRARDSGEPVMAGPVELVRGGKGFIGRFPVFTRAAGGERRFWGLVSAILDVNRLYVDSGIAGPDLPFDLAIVGQDGTGAEGERFFGSSEVMANDPVTADVSLPSGTWRLAAVPKTGWNTLPENAWLLRLRMLLAGALIVVPIVMTGRLIGERQNHIGELKRAKMLTEARNTELLMAKARIEHNALHDSLTGLPNRRYLDQRLDLLSSQPDGSGARIALLHIDLDRFKQINDTLGHAAGDAMLVHAACVLQRNVRPVDFVARVGGDEFVVMCRIEAADREADSTYLAALADRIIQEMRQPVPYENHKCRFGVSVGIAGDSADGELRRLLVNADIALYRAKSRGRNCHQFFNAALEAEIVETKRIADEILGGLEQGQFIPYFQPQFDAETLEVAGVEALARWNHPTRGMLGPSAFMKTAEELNVVTIIDRIILEQALVRFEEWQAAGLGVPKVSVNVSARRLQDEELMASLRRLPIVPGTVSFELVESIFLDEKDDQIIGAVEQIKELGIDIEIDDFGTGYASIVSLLKLKPRRLKIDQQLVMPLLDSPAQRDLVESIIDIGKSLGIGVTAEGVETIEHARVLRRLGCDAVQGYAFAKAMSNADFERFLRDRLRIAV